jgi:tRNA (mo5U34)-methyltransferase
MNYHPLHATLAPLRPYKGSYNAHAVVSESRKVWHLIKRSPHWNGIRKRLSHFIASSSLAPVSTDLYSDTIGASLTEAVNDEELKELCRSLISWRVGPYQLGSLSLDTEWRSFMKWNRVSPLIPQRAGMRIADIGCSNGYFVYKLSTLQPEIAVGFDPVERCWLQHALLQSILRVPKIAFVPMGLLALDAFPNFFDLTLCMGVIYHQRDQGLAVRRLYEATRPGGHALLESLVVDRDEPLVITPPDRYAKMRNAWTIPSPPLLERLFRDAGFTDVQVHRFGPLTPDEQRRTELAPFESLADFLDPSDHSRTVEGHPAPHTAAVIGRKME